MFKPLNRFFLLLLSIFNLLCNLRNVTFTLKNVFIIAWILNMKKMLLSDRIYSILSLISFRLNRLPDNQILVETCSFGHKFVCHSFFLVVNLCLSFYFLESIVIRMLQWNMFESQCVLVGCIAFNVNINLFLLLNSVRCLIPSNKWPLSQVMAA
jgi:hypothetical protein